MKTTFSNLLKQIKEHRRLLSGGAFALALLLILSIVNLPSVVGAAATNKVLPIYCVKRDDKCVSLTFDAACGNVI